MRTVALMPAQVLGGTRRRQHDFGLGSVECCVISVDLAIGAQRSTAYLGRYPYSGGGEGSPGRGTRQPKGGELPMGDQMPELNGDTSWNLASTFEEKLAGAADLFILRVCLLDRRCTLTSGLVLER